MTPKLGTEYLYVCPVTRKLLLLTKVNVVGRVKRYFKRKFYLGARCAQNKFKDHLLTTPRPGTPLGSEPATTGRPLSQVFLSSNQKQKSCPCLRGR